MSKRSRMFANIISLMILLLPMDSKQLILKPRSREKKCDESLLS